MSHGYNTTFSCIQPDVVAPDALRAGNHAAAQALSTFDAAMMRRLQPLAVFRRSELAGVDYLDSSVLEYALSKALEAAFPQTGGEPPPPLSRYSFVLRITKDQSG